MYTIQEQNGADNMLTQCNYVDLNNLDRGISSIDFSWIDKWMLYIVCVPREAIPPNNKRSQGCIHFIQCYYIFLICYYVFLVIFIHDQYQQNTTDSDGGKIAQTVNDVIFINVNLLYNITQLLARIFALYFYYFCFKYPWYSTVDALRFMKPIDPYSKYKKCAYSVLPRVLLVIYFFGSILFWIVYLFVHKYSTMIYILRILGVFFFVGVNFVLIIVQSTICFKYDRYLTTLSGNIPTMDSGDVLLKYKAVYEGFMTDYVFSLKWGIRIAMAANVINIWVSIFVSNVVNPDAETWDYFGAAMNVFIIAAAVCALLLYVMSAVFMNETVAWNYFNQLLVSSNILNGFLLRFHWDRLESRK